jgi:predicted small lipoprotein YifL
MAAYGVIIFRFCFTQFFIAAKIAPMKSAISAFLLAAVMIGLAGCLPTSKNPLSDPDAAVADTHLDGVWYGKSGEDAIFLHFVSGKAASMDIVEVDHQSGEAHTSIYTMFPSVIEGQRYMNIREKNGEDKPYYFARYTISKSGALTIWLMSEKPVAKAVKAEKLTGKVTVKNAGESNETRDITLTTSTESLAAYVRKADPEILFAEKFGTFKKLTLPSLEATSTDEASAKSTTSEKPTPKPKKKKAADD